MKKPRKHCPRRLQYENLESRQMMTAGLTASLSSKGVLTVTGTAGNDGINFHQTGGVISVQDVVKTWTAAKVKSIVVDVKGGNDDVSFDSFANGGNQAIAEQITVKGGVGTDLVHLGGGKNVNIGGGANTLVVAATGAAALNGVALNLTNAVQLSFLSGVLTVTGTNSNDDIKILQGSGWVGIQGGTQWFAASTVHSIIVNLQEGADNLSFDSLQNGGNQAVTAALTVRGGLGTGTVRFPDGGTTSISGLGNTLTYVNGVTKLNSSVLHLVDTVTMSLSNGVLTVTGKTGDDALYFWQNNGWIGLWQQSTTYNASTVTSIVINLQGGNDYVSLDSLAGGNNQAITAPITVNSTAGAKQVRCPNGNTASFSGSHQLKVLASGAVNLDNVELWPAPTPPTPPATNWFDTHVQDAALRALGHNIYTDGLVSRSDMLSLLRDAEDGGIVDSTELTDLQLVAGTSSLFGGVESLQKLTSYIVSATPANAHYMGGNLGNLAAGAATAQLEKLINKWFFGLDRPTASGTYRQVAGTLFVNGAAYSDVHQGQVGDCYFVASLGEAAYRNATTITNMFTANGDGTYTVKFFSGATSYYVTVDSYLPTYGGGQLIYASPNTGDRMYNNSSNELWVALAEKAYCQLNEFGFSRAGFAESGQNAYTAIEGGYIYAAQNHITGFVTSAFAMTSGGFNTFVTAFNAGKLIGFASYSHGGQDANGVVGSHAYAVVGYNAANQTVTLFNPWGTEYGQLTLNWSQITTSFMYFDRTA